MADKSITKVSSAYAPKGPAGQRYLAAGVQLSMRLWEKENESKITDGKPNIHAYVVLGKHYSTTCGGHLMEAEVRPTLEVTESPSHLVRRFDKEGGPALISLDSTPPS